MRHILRHVVLLAVTFVWVLPAVAQEPGPAVVPIASGTTRISPKWDSLASPREAMFTFLEAQAGALKGKPDDFDRALKTLDLSGAADRDPLRVIGQLIGVLDRLGEVKEIELPDGVQVKKNDWHRFEYFPRGGMHKWVWEVLGHTPVGSIVIVETAPGKWQFSSRTIAELDGLYRSVADLPPVYVSVEDRGQLIGLFGPTFEKTLWWQWAILLVAIFFGLLVGKILQALLRKVAGGLEIRDWEVRATVFRDAASPISLVLLTLSLTVGLAFIHLEPGLDDFRWKVLKLLYLLSAGWFIYNLIDVADAMLRNLAEKTASKLDDMVVPLVRKTLRIFLVIVFFIVVLQNVFELNITGFLASLGIAGLAVSLAAQDSIKNLFGSLTVFFDKPFAVGDFIEFGGNRGSVEEIGFRSTRLRLLSGHLVTIPNMKFIDSGVENISARPYIRRKMDVTITYDTPPDNIEKAVEIFRDVLHDPEVVEAGRFDMDKFPPRLAFNELNADSLNIRADYWYQLAGDPDRGFFSFLQHSQTINLKLFRAYGKAGIEFAFPTQTLFLAGDPARRLSVEAKMTGGSGGVHAYT